MLADQVAEGLLGWTLLEPVFVFERQFEFLSCKE